MDLAPGVGDRKATPALTVPAWLWHPNLTVFIASFCTMVLELVAGRIIAPYVGVSLYTWTTVIGVVLAGISLGNYLGGRFADRWAGLRLVGAIFLLGGLACLGVLAVDNLGSHMPGSWPIVVQILALTAALFFIPCTILGCISPAVAKLAVRDLSRTGSTVGKIYAFSTVGSIAGTFATGFWLISSFGTHAIVLGVAAILFLLGFLFLLAGRPGALVVAALVVLLTSAAVWRAGSLRGPCLRETNYFCIKVQEEERDGHKVRVLILDRLVHSYSSLEDPTRLVYGYEQTYADLVRAKVASLPGGRPLRALFIGGGGYTFPRYLAAVYPGSQLQVVEIDPGVTQTAYDFLGLRKDGTVRTANEDARQYLESAPAQSYDLILGDAFNDFSVPYHLTTREFGEQVRRWLSPDGLYLVNLIDGPRREFLRAYVATLQEVFAHVYVIPSIASWRESPRVTFVVVGTDRPLDPSKIAALAPNGDSAYERLVLSPSQLQSLLSAGPQVILTDQYAPVEQMLAPVYRGEPAQ